MRTRCGLALIIYTTLVAFPVVAFAQNRTLNGTVTDTTAKPLAGASVWVWQDHDVFRAETDAEGRFSFSNLNPFPGHVVAWKDGLSVGGRFVNVMGAAPATIALAEPDNLTVVVKSFDFKPLAGALLRVAFVNDEFMTPAEELAEAGLPSVRSDEEGRLVIANLPKGGHARLVVGHRDHADETVIYLPVGGKEQTIILNPGTEIQGRVDSPTGGVSRARISATRMGAGRPEVSETLTDPEGFYHVRLEAGNWLLTCRHPEFASPQPCPMTVKESPEPITLDFKMSVQKQLEGKVVFPDNSPCVGAPVSYWIGNTLYQEVFAQVDGTFRLAVPNVAGRVRVIPPDGFMTEQLGDIPIGGDIPDRMELVPVRVKELPAVEGIVLGEDGTPQPNCLISSIELNPPAWAITDAEGRFAVRLRQAPPEGEARFRAEHAERFLRADFRAKFDAPEPAKATLVPFEPDLTTRTVDPNKNDMTGMVGVAAPPISCDAWFNTEAVTLDSLKGKVVVLLFWGAFEDQSALIDAIEEFRAMGDLLKSAQDVALLGIHDSGKYPPEIERYLKAHRIEFPVGRDADPFQTFDKYTIRYIPQVVLIDKHGVFRYFQTEGRLLELIKSLRREA